MTVSELHILEALESLRDKCHQNSKDHGFWDEATTVTGRKEKPWNFGEKIALIHSELSEMFEAWRKNIKESEKEIIIFDPAKQSMNPSDQIVTRRITAIEEEVADVFIRMFDLCGKLDIDVGRVILTKHEYNKTRPYLHGGRKC